VTVRAALAAKKARYEQILNANGALDALPEAVTSDTLRALRDRYAIASSKLAELSAQLMPKHPFVIAAQQEQAKLQNLIEDEIARIAAAAKLEYERSAETESSLERQLEDLKQQALETNEALIKLRELERDASASRTVYEAALVRARETRELQQINSINARIITHATPPDFKSWPPRLLILLPAGLVFGIALGLGLALLRERVGARRHADLRVLQRIGLRA